MAYETKQAIAVGIKGAEEALRPLFHNGAVYGLDYETQRLIHQVMIKLCCLRSIAVHGDMKAGAV